MVVSRRVCLVEEGGEGKGRVGMMSVCLEGRKTASLGQRSLAPLLLILLRRRRSSLRSPRKGKKEVWLNIYGGL